MEMNNPNNLRIGFIESRIRELKLDIQCMEYAIECSKKTKTPEKSLMRPRRFGEFLEILSGLKDNVDHILDEVKYHLSEEQKEQYDELFYTW